MINLLMITPGPDFMLQNSFWHG